VRGWVRRAAEKGFGPDRVEALLSARHRPAALDRAEVEARVLGEEGTTRERPTFDQGTVLRELISALPPGTNLGREELLAWATRLVADDEVVRVENADVRTYTTTGMLQSEQQLLALAIGNVDPPLAQLDRTVAVKALARSGLRPDQLDLAYVLLTSGNPIDVVSGSAGSGKTKGLSAATSTWTSQGVEVRGTAVAALTAQGLQDATAAPSISLARLLQQPQTHLPHRGVLLVDEAGMIGTRQLLRLLTLSEQRECKVVLVGDPAQLPELEAGGSFAALTRLPTSLHLDGHGRQITAWEQHALLDLRNGRTTEALDAYHENDRLHIAITTDELHQRVVADYKAARREAADPWDVVVLTPRRHDVAQLNELIREQLRADGVLGRRVMRAVTPHGPRDYRKGDQVLVTHNDHSRQLLNGTRGTVRTVRRDGLVVQLTDGRRVLLEKAWLARGELDHGYAMTLHKAQGRTVHTSLVIGDESLSQEGGYVGLSRGTHVNHLYLDAGSEAVLRDCGDIHRPGKGWRPEPTRPSRALTRSGRQDLALNALRTTPEQGISR
jgi:ATP-dependent exoDNAse (exonuclease V) alpha subunit